MLFLSPPEIGADLGLDAGITLAEEVLEHHVFGRDRRIGLEVEGEVTVLPLLPSQCGCGPVDGTIEVIEDRSRDVGRRSDGNGGKRHSDS